MKAQFENADLESSSLGKTFFTLRVLMVALAFPVIFMLAMTHNSKEDISKHNIQETEKLVVLNQ
jgi:hypothetical protein